MVLLEVCIDDLEGARAALRGQAQRLEVCSRLDVGGLTPHDELLRQLKAETRVPLYCMVRPRGGDFVLRDDDLARTLEDLERVLDGGADGVVYGWITPDGRVDRAALEQLVARSRGVPVTFHRAFEQVNDPVQELEVLIACGVTRVLTAGGAKDAHAGRQVLRTLVEAARGRIGILPGGGVRAHNAAEILTATGVSELHSSTVFPTAALSGF
jgi:copper homeostasis protein